MNECYGSDPRLPLSRDAFYVVDKVIDVSTDNSGESSKCKCLRIAIMTCQDSMFCSDPPSRLFLAR